MSSLRYSRAARASTSLTRGPNERFALMRDGVLQVRTVEGRSRNCRNRERPTVFDCEGAARVMHFLNGRLQPGEKEFEVVPYRGS